MSMDHYVPRLILRNFVNKTTYFSVDEKGHCKVNKVVKDKSLSLYNFKSAELEGKRNVGNIFAEEQFYPDEIEAKLNVKIEDDFAKLFNGKLINSENEINLSDKERLLIKKFILIVVIRSGKQDNLISQEKDYYRYDESKIRNILEPTGRIATDDVIKNIKDNWDVPFEEIVVENETLIDYWNRTLDVILDSDGSPNSIKDQKMKTHMAYRWSLVINAGYLAFWDADSVNDEFVVTDVGMTSENEKGWNGVTVHNGVKLNTLITALDKLNNVDSCSNVKGELLEVLKQNISNQIDFAKNFPENFQMFSISSRRMIVLISPYFKYADSFGTIGISNFPKLSDLSCFTNENLFMPNKTVYKAVQTSNEIIRDPKDEYIYEIKKLKKDEIRYCNALFLDRIENFVGFSNFNKVVGSLLTYKKLNKPPFSPRNDYSKLYELIREKYII